jgi:hypothetical protein
MVESTSGYCGCGTGQNPTRGARAPRPATSQHRVGKRRRGSDGAPCFAVAGFGARKINLQRDFAVSGKLGRTNHFRNADSPHAKNATGAPPSFAISVRLSTPWVSPGAMPYRSRLHAAGGRFRIIVMLWILTRLQARQVSLLTRLPVTVTRTTVRDDSPSASDGTVPDASLSLLASSLYSSLPNMN